jgi:hypothetical protein
MATIGAKVQHVLAAKQTRQHGCHWPGCTQQVPPAMWGCRPHWYTLPAELRARIWRTYRPGQEKDQSPRAITWRWRAKCSSGSKNTSAFNNRRNRWISTKAT